MLDALPLHQAELEVERCQKAGGIFRAQNASGVGIKGEGNGNTTDAHGGVHRSLQDGLMAEVHSVKDSDSQHQGRVDFRESVDGVQSFHQAPRSLETAGRERMRWAMASIGPAFSSATVTAPSTLKRPDFVRRRDLRCAPQLSSSPISLA